MRLLVWRVVNKTLKFRLILLTINSPLTATRRESQKLCFCERKSVSDAKISQNYTSYYQLTFSEYNRIVVSVNSAWLSIKAISVTTKQSKHEQHEAKQLNHKLHTKWSRARSEWKINVTEKDTRNAQPGACVDVLPRCSCLVHSRPQSHSA